MRCNSAQCYYPHKGKSNKKGGNLWVTIKSIILHGGGIALEHEIMLGECNFLMRSVCEEINTEIQAYDEEHALSQFHKKINTLPFCYRIISVQEINK